MASATLELKVKRTIVQKAAGAARELGLVPVAPAELGNRETAQTGRGLEKDPTCLVPGVLEADPRGGDLWLVQNLPGVPAGDAHCCNETRGTTTGLTGAATASPTHFGVHQATS